MTKDEFKAIFKQYSDRKDNKVIECRWLTGGLDGGSCWDDGTVDNHFPVSGEPEPVNWGFEEIIMEHFRNISFMDYKILTQKYVEYDTDEQNEYYGNYSTYGIKRIHFDNFYKFMKEAGYVD